MDFPQSKGKKRIHIDMTPLVDVAFLLLTFFMLTAQFSSSDAVPIVLPKAKSNGLAPQTNTLTLSMTEGKPLYLLLESMTIRDTILEYIPGTKIQISNSRLDSLLKNFVFRISTFNVVLKSDKDVSYGNIQEVMQILKSNKIKRFNMLTEGD